MYNCERPIFIFGCPRSGTSLLSRILNSHPQIGIPFESHFYSKFLPRIGRYGNLRRESNRRLLLRDMLSLLHEWSPDPDLERALAGMREPSLHGAIDSIMSDWCAMHGKRRWGEKTPRHLFQWREIYSGFPRAQFVHLIRDGRDVALSWKKARFGPKHLYVAARRWRENLAEMSNAREAIPAAQFFELRYEDLLAAPEETARALCNYLGETFSIEMLSFYKDPTPYRTDARNNRNVRRPLIRDNVEKWRREMGTRDLHIVEAAAKDELEGAGYPVVNADARVGRLEGLGYRAVLHPLLRLGAMARNKRGHLEAMREFWALSKNRLVWFRR